MPRKHKRSSWGCVTRRGRDTWLIRWWDDAPGGRKRRCETVHGSRFDADERLAEIRISTRKESTPTVSYYWNRYYSHDVAKLRPNTQKLYLTAWSRIEASLGSTPVSAVTPMAIQELMDTMGGHAANVTRGVLRRTLDYAILMGVIGSNPASAPLKLPAAKEYAKGIYKLDEIETLLAAARGDALEAAIIVQACAGLRVGESIGVKVEDVQFYDGYATISVKRQVTKDGEVSDPKTFNSLRTTLMLDPYASRLREIAGENPGEEWLTPSGVGGPCSRWALNRAWARISKRLPDEMERIPMRNLRNSYETWMHWEKGFPIDIVSKFLGHKDIKVTLEHYDRPGDDEIIARAVRLMEDGERMGETAS